MTHPPPLDRKAPTVPNLPDVLKLVLWLAALGGVILVASKLATKAAGRAASAV